MFQKLLWWRRVWPQGTPYATRPFMNQAGGIEDAVTQREVRVPWKKAEFEHLVRILQAVKPEWSLTADLARVLPVFDRARLLPDGNRLLPMRSYQKDINEIIAAVASARGRSRNELADLAEKQEQEGKSIWDVGA